MSKKKEILVIQVPEIVAPLPKESSLIQGIRSVEHFSSTGHRCSYCNGSGGFWGENHRGEATRKKCPLCEGSGMLDAVITIEWKARKDDNEQLR